MDPNTQLLHLHSSYLRGTSLYNVACTIHIDLHRWAPTQHTPTHNLPTDLAGRLLPQDTTAGLLSDPEATQPLSRSQVLVLFFFSISRV